MSAAATQTTKTVGVTMSRRVVAGLIVDHKLSGALHYFPEDPDDDAIVELPTDGVVEKICEQIIAAANGAKDIGAVGLAVPGLIGQGVVEEAPNLPQLKGTRIQELLTQALKSHGLEATVVIMNDA